MDIVLSRADVLVLPESAREHIRTHSLTNTDGDYQISLDNNQFTNHSYEPNLSWYAEGNEFIANRHIDAGVELTKDYRSFSHSAFAKSLINKSI
jgi:SET domain-containing protein